MHSPGLINALSGLMDKIDDLLQGSPNLPEVEMYLAGGIALHYHCGTRYTEDVDASFSRRLLLPYDELTIAYQREDGTWATLYLDPNYNDGFALMHPDYKANAVEWSGLGNESRRVKVRVLTPLDLVLSKISRFSPQDQADIHALLDLRTFNSQEFETQCSEALDYYVGNTDWIKYRVKEIAGKLRAQKPLQTENRLLDGLI